MPSKVIKRFMRTFRTEGDEKRVAPTNGRKINTKDQGEQASRRVAQISLSSVLKKRLDVL